MAVELRGLSGVNDRTTISLVDELVQENTQIRAAHAFSMAAHEGQTRRTGEPFFEHPKEVAEVAARLGLPEVMVVAALLHDVCEDTSITIEDIADNFGQEVAHLVDGVTKLKSSRDDTTDSEKVDRDTLRKVASEGMLDHRIIILKLIDRFVNMQTLSVFDIDKQKAKAGETLSVYAKLAEAIGWWEMKQALEDMAFPYLDPQNHSRIREEIDGDPRLDPGFLQRYTGFLKGLLGTHQIKGEVATKASGAYYLDRKKNEKLITGKAQGRGLGAINDVVSIRVTLDARLDCYTLLGVIASEFSESGAASDLGVYEQTEIDDYLAKPQLNHYSALHLTLTTPQGPIEIALTTHGREEINNLGAVKYVRDGQKDELAGFAIKIIFDQDGNAFFVPADAKLIDVLYAVFPSTAFQANGALIDGEEAGLESAVSNTATISPIYQTKGLPDHGQLAAGVLPQTRKAIETYLAISDRRSELARGRSLCEKILSPRGFLDIQDLPEGLRRKLLLGFRMSGIEELLIGLIQSNTLTARFANELDNLGVNKERLGYTTLRVSGLNREGIMRKVGEIIGELGGNVERMELGRNDDHFIWRLAIRGLGGKKEKQLQKRTRNLGIFDEITVV